MPVVTVHQLPYLPYRLPQQQKSPYTVRIKAY